MGQNNGPQRSEQLVQPAKGSGRFDHGSKLAERFECLADVGRLSVFPTHRRPNFACVVNRRDHDRLTMQVNTNVPHDKTPD